MIKRMISLFTCFTLILTFNLITSPHNVSAQNAQDNSLLAEQIQRKAGNHRYGLAGLIATYGWPQTSEYAVIANAEEDFPGALLKNSIFFGDSNVVNASALTSRNKPTTYTNTEYGFSLQLPDDWAGCYRVEECKSNARFMFDEETRFTFYYNIKNEDYVIFWISVYPDSKVEIDSEGCYGLLRKITSDNDLTYLWGIPSELHRGLLPEEQHRDEIRFIRSKIEQTEEIIGSFKL